MKPDLPRRASRHPHPSLLALLVLVAAGTPPAFAQSQSIGVVVAPAEPAREGFLQLEADFSVRPSVTSTTLGAGVQTLDLVVFCVDLFTGQILPFCDVALTPQRVPGSGGHDHDDASRPIGSFDPASGNTGSDGLLPVTYTSPEVSGVVQTTITGVTQDGNPVIPGVFTIGVEITGLVDLGAGTDYDLVGQTGNHGDNHYGTQAFVGSLATLATSYATAYPGSRLAYNDMSLVAGGLFDISGGWSRPHSSHRFGNDLDLRLVAPERRRRLRQLIIASGIPTVIVEGDHWHIRQ